MAGSKVTNAGSKYYVCTTPQTAIPLSQTAFEALTWVEIKNVGNRGDLGANANIVSYNTMDTDVTQKAKGITDAGDFTLECARVFDDPGQIALRAAGRTKYQYAIKVELSDAPGTGFTNTTIYNCGVVTGPVLNGGGPEDFVTETFTIGFNQLPVIVESAAE